MSFPERTLSHPESARQGMLTIDARWVNNAGMGTYLRHVIPGLLDAFPDHDFCLLGDRETLESRGWLDRPRVRCIALTSPMYSVSEQWQLLRQIPPETTLFFCTHYNVPLLYTGAMLVTVYDLIHLAVPSAGSTAKRLYARALFKAVRRKALAVITISEFTRGEFVRFTGPERQPVFAIHLGVDEEWFHVSGAANVGDTPYILFVGSVKPHKNLSNLVSAFGRMISQVPHRLLIVGRREGLITRDRKVERLAEELGDRVAFTGYVADDTLKRLVAGASVLVLPSLYEGFGLPPLEAMAAGCPVAVSDIPVFREVCGDAAWYFDPNDPVDIAARLTELLLNPDIAGELKRRGSFRARELGWDSCVARTCEVVRTLFAKIGT